MPGQQAAQTENRVRFLGGNVVEINFEGITTKGGGAAAHVTPEDYLLQVTNCEIKVTNDKTGRYVNWTNKIIAGPGRGTIYQTTGLTLKSLWSTRRQLEAMGKTVPDHVKIDFSKLIGGIFGATLGDDEPFPKTDANGNQVYDAQGNPVFTIKSIIIEPYTQAEYERIAAARAPESADTGEEQEQAETASAPAPVAVAPAAKPKAAAKPKPNGAAAAPAAEVTETEVPAGEDDDLAEIPFAELG